MRKGGSEKCGSEGSRKEVRVEDKEVEEGREEVKGRGEQK